MLSNRSMPRCTVIPELAYPNVVEAADWLCDVFGFSVRLRIANHRTQLNVGDGAVVLTVQAAAERPLESAHAVMVRVEDVDGHHAHALTRGARILRPPADYPYGERHNQSPTPAATAGRSRSRSLTPIQRTGAARRDGSKDPLQRARPRPRSPAA